MKKGTKRKQQTERNFKDLIKLVFNTNVILYVYM